MILDILRHTPTWVFAVFVALLALGFLQTRARSVPLALLVALPCAMAIWSVSSLLQRVGVDALAAWGALEVACVVVALRLGPRDDVQYSAADRSFSVPGSWIPLALMMFIFFTRYVIGVLVAMHPTLPGTMVFDLLVGSVSGLSAGTFAGRALRIGRVARGRGPFGRAVVSAS
jgi:hypothetical protein